MAARIASAPAAAAIAIPSRAPSRLTSAAAGNITTLKPIQNTGIRYGRSSAAATCRYCGAELSEKCTWNPAAISSSAEKKSAMVDRFGLEGSFLEGSFLENSLGPEETRRST